MTLCLAGVCKSGDAIAFAFDERMSSTTSGFDVLSKAARMGRWVLLLAGDDIGLAGGIYDRVKRELLKAPPMPVAKAIEAVTVSHSRVLLDEVVPHLLAPHGITYQQFKQNPSRVPDPVAIQDEINRARYGCSFLLAGFDDRGLPQTVVLPAQSNPVYGRWGFSALGSGSTIAEHYLQFCGFSSTLSWREAAYHLCAAKFFAESGTVGPTTKVRLLTKDGKRMHMDAAPIRALWTREGQPRVPDKLLTKMPQFVRPDATPSAARAGRARRSVRQSVQSRHV